MKYKELQLLLLNMIFSQVSSRIENKSTDTLWDDELNGFVLLCDYDIIKDNVTREIMTLKAP